MNRITHLQACVLLVLSGAGKPLTPAEIAARAKANEKAIYASMSTMGKAGKRWWIRAERHWRRDGKFRVTSAGLRHLERMKEHA